MFSTAFAQSAAGGAGAMGSGLQMILLFVPLMAIWYFLLIRPQRRQAKQRQETLAAIRRGDQIIAGGLVGKVTKVIDDSELEVEIADGVRTRILRSYVSEVRVKGEPVKTEDPKAKS